jgi:hypothetical protein
LALKTCISHHISGFSLMKHEGIAGHKAYGEDSEIYGACGFVRTSERKSGLHRGVKAKTATPNKLRTG